MVEELNQDNPVKVLSKEEIALFLQVQHAQGNIHCIDENAVLEN
jgi:hypothetical protein